MPRRAARTDANQTEIVEALRKAGMTVESLAAVGDGVPDLLVGYMNVNVLLEVKDPNKDRKEYRERIVSRVLTDDQKKWHFFWQGQKDVVWDAEEAIAKVRAYAGL